MNNLLLRELIQQYKSRFPQIHAMEIYKWQAVKHFQENWDPEASDFSSMLKNSLGMTSNLMVAANYFPRLMIEQFAQSEPEQVRKNFSKLFDEEGTLDYVTRIGDFRKSADRIRDRYFQGQNTYQDHRAVLVYLALRYPNEYFLYKFQMFKQFGAIVGYDYQPVRGRDSNIPQYMNLCSFVRDEIIRDNELLKMHTDRIGADEYFDSSYNILTQDVIYAATVHLDPNSQTSRSIDSGLIHQPTHFSIAAPQEITLEGTHINFVGKAQRDKQIGDRGELLVLEYERQICPPKYRKKVEHVSITQGDGLGYDILSFDENGNEKYIEVKTTTSGFFAPFYVSKAELALSELKPSQYYLYRLFNFDGTANRAYFEVIQGSLQSMCNSPVNYEVALISSPKE